MTVSRKNISTETTWESIFGYSRVVRIGPYVYLSGTTATDKSGNVVGIDNPYMQSVQIIKNIQTALQRVDAHLTDVVRTRIYTTNIGNWEKIGQAHLEFFKEIRPACTLVEVNRLISAEMLVEMEADAIVT
jgi:enamine deaminase RidA (YjgF/YER057c/UK114 family)